MLDFRQAEKLVTDVLHEMNAYSPIAVKAIMMVAAHESKGGTYLSQVGSGIALGFTQVERPTHSTVWAEYDNIDAKAALMNIRSDFNRLRYDLRYSIFITRCYFLMDTNPFPIDEMGLAKYLKYYWNSEKGAATPEKYLSDYLAWRDS